MFDEQVAICSGLTTAISLGICCPADLFRDWRVHQILLQGLIECQNLLLLDPEFQTNA